MVKYTYAAQTCFLSCLLINNGNHLLMTVVIRYTEEEPRHTMCLFVVLYINIVSHVLFVYQQCAFGIVRLPLAHGSFRN